MRSQILSLALLVLFGSVSAFASDPVLMKINGKPVYKSEFEYIYNKNNSKLFDMLWQPFVSYLKKGDILYYSMIILNSINYNDNLIEKILQDDYYSSSFKEYKIKNEK
jgi:hypothetical protein